MSLPVLVLCVGAMLPDVSVSLHADRQEMRLSDIIHVTLRIEGPAPLRVELPQLPLDETSAEAWKLQPAGEVKIAPLADGRERWERTYRAEPYRPGEPLRLGFVSLPVRAGSSAVVKHTPEPLEIRVTTSISDPGPSSIRPITGIEELPPANAGQSVLEKKQALKRIAWILGALMILTLGAIYFLHRLKMPLPTPREWWDHELRFLAEGQFSAAELGERLDAALRSYLQSTRNVPALRQTTGELLAALDQQTLDEPTRDRLRLLLETCDWLRFAPASAAVDRDSLLSEAQAVVTQLEAQP